MYFDRKIHFLFWGESRAFCNSVFTYIDGREAVISCLLSIYDILCVYYI